MLPFKKKNNIKNASRKTKLPFRRACRVAPKMSTAVLNEIVWIPDTKVT